MKNWQTTLIGAIGAISIALAPYFQSGQLPDGKTLVTAIIVALLGLAAKDARQTPPPPTSKTIPLIGIGLLFATLLGLSGCANGQYVGPSVGISAGYDGISIGFTVYGQNPVIAASISGSSPKLSGTAALVATP